MAYYEFKISLPGEFRNNLIKILTEKGALGFFDEDDGVSAYFPDTADLKELTGALNVVKALLETAGFQENIEFSSSLLPDRDWNESWKKSFKAFDVGKAFTILPPWDKLHPHRINMIIDPGMAFGTGHHETTRSCLVLMEKHAERTEKDRFLDLGAGTGLLAIAASKTGYRQVVAVDTDPLAAEATRKNVKLNRVSNVEVREGSITEAPGRFDCIAANIISGVLVLLAPAIAAHLTTSGIAILSGMLSEQADEVVTAYVNFGLKLVERHRDGKWCSIVLGK